MKDIQSQQSPKSIFGMATAVVLLFVLPLKAQAVDAFEIVVCFSNEDSVDIGCVPANTASTEVVREAARVRGGRRNRDNPKFSDVTITMEVGNHSPSLFLATVLRQVWTSVMIIVSDNGSDDGGSQIFKITLNNALSTRHATDAGRELGPLELVTLAYEEICLETAGAGDQRCWNLLLNTEG